MSQSKLDLMDLRARQRAASEQKMLGGIEALRRGAFDIESLRDRKRKQAIEDEERGLLKSRVEDAEGLKRLQLIAQGLARGQNDLIVPRVGGPEGSTIIDHTESDEEKRARFLEAARRSAPGLVDKMGRDASLGVYAGAVPVADPLVGLRLKKLEADIEASKAKTGLTTTKVEAEKRKDERVGIKNAVSGVSPKARDLRRGDVDAVEKVIEEYTSVVAGDFPTLSDVERKGIVTKEVYDTLDAQIKEERAREREAYKRQQDELKSERATKRTMTTQDQQTLLSKKEAIETLEGLKKFASRPAIKNNWKRYSVGANELAQVTGQYVDGVIDLGQYQAAQKTLDMRFERDALGLEFLREVKRAVFTVGRGLNGPGVMTDSDLQFWSRALMNTDGSYEEFANAVNSELGVVEKSYLSTIRDYQEIVHRVSGEHTKYKPRYLGDVEFIEKSRPLDKSEKLGGLETLTDVKNAVGNVVNEIDVLRPGASVGRLLTGDPPKEQPRGETVFDEKISIARNIDEAKALYETAKRSFDAARTTPGSADDEELGSLAAKANAARRQWELWQKASR